LTPRARKPDAALLQRLAPELIGPGADRLDETQLPGTLDELVAPQPRDHQDIGLGNPLLKLLKAPHFKTRDTGVALQKPLLQPVGDMRKADRRLVPRRQHDQLLPSRPAAHKIP
jgi:hypothetical protein